MPQTLTTQQPGTDLQQGQESFNTNLLKLLESTTSTNLVVSPHSIHSVFSQLLQGSGGRTQAELESVLGVRAGGQLEEQYNNLGAALTTRGSTLKEANLLAVAQGFKPHPSYRSSLLRGFKSDIREYDFNAQKGRSVADINRYVEDNTNNKIQDLLADDDVDGFTRMILVNAVYFKANWKFAFAPEKTFQFDFQSPSGNVRSPFMNRDAEVRVLEDKARQLDILELPYDDPSKSMLIVLPKSGVSSDRLMERMDGLDFADVRKKGRLADTTITIPKFKLKFQTYLTDKMTSLGVRDLFTERANLSGVSSEPLFASSAVHQAFIEVNEEGTEAAAATAAVVGLRSARKKRQFFADRPFIFLVYDVPQDVVLFAGKVVDPTSDSVIQSRASLVQPEQAVSSTVQQDGGSQPFQPQQSQQASSGANRAVCEKLFRDFPNSLDNSNICQRVESEGKRLDWLRNNRALCEESKDFFNNFQSKSCGEWWCLEAASHVRDWRKEASSALCEGIENRVETVETKRACKNMKNKLKAVEFLNCTI